MRRPSARPSTTWRGSRCRPCPRACCCCRSGGRPGASACGARTRACTSTPGPSARRGARGPPCPAALLLLPLGWEAWRERLWRADPRLHFYAVAFAAHLGAWSLVPGKQLHYVLGLLPLFALIAGRRIAARF